MGISIYYTARRSSALNDVEQAAIAQIREKYSISERLEKFHSAGGDWPGEDFCLYESPLDSPDMILDGATQLPLDTEAGLWEALQHWCRALSEIRRLVPDADWHVHMDDHDIEWDEKRQKFDPTR